MQAYVKKYHEELDTKLRDLRMMEELEWKCRSVEEREPAAEK